MGYGMSAYGLDLTYPTAVMQRQLIDLIEQRRKVGDFSSRPDMMIFWGRAFSQFFLKNFVKPQVVRLDDGRLVVGQDPDGICFVDQSGNMVYRGLLCKELRDDEVVWEDAEGNETPNAPVGSRYGSIQFARDGEVRDRIYGIKVG